MKEPRFLTLDEVLALHSDQVRRYGGSAGIRDVGLLLSAVAMPRASFRGSGTCTHRCIDAKKRIGLAASIAFLGLNDVWVDSDPDKLLEMVLKVARGESPALTVFGNDYPTRDGTCMRDYVHVDDLADAHVLALKALDEDHLGGVFNLGCGGDGYSVLDVVEAARAVTGRQIDLTWAARRPGDPAVLIASSDEIRRQLGWRPRFDDIHAIVASAWGWMHDASGVAHAAV